MFLYNWHPFQILVHPWEQKKKGHKERGWASRGVGGGTQPPFCFQPKERRSADTAEFQQESLVTLDSIFVEDFRHCFQKWEQRWDCCMQSQGKCFEGG